MSEEKFREWISSEFEKEAEELEKRLQEHEAADPELAALEMPEDSFDDLMRRIKAEMELPKGYEAHFSSSSMTVICPAS